MGKYGEDMISALTGRESSQGTEMFIDVFAQEFHNFQCCPWSQGFGDQVEFYTEQDGGDAGVSKSMVQRCGVSRPEA